MSTDNTLLQQIDALVESRTFNLDALDAIKKIKDQLASTLDELARCKKLADERLSEISRLRGECELHVGSINAMKAKIKADEETVLAGQKAIYEADKQKAVAEAIKGTMETVFRPSQVRETVWQSIPIAQGSNGNTWVTTHAQETRTTKESA
jgi:hypothetical protein